MGRAATECLKNAASNGAGSTAAVAPCAINLWRALHGIRRPPSRASTRAMHRDRTARIRGCNGAVLSLGVRLDRLRYPWRSVLPLTLEQPKAQGRAPSSFGAGSRAFKVMVYCKHGFAVRLRGFLWPDRCGVHAHAPSATEIVDKDN